MVTTPMGMSDNERPLDQKSAPSGGQPIGAPRRERLRHHSAIRSAAKSSPRLQGRSTAAPETAIPLGRRTGQPMFARRFALAVAVLAGLIGSQGPEFAQQYRQRLGGALEELNRIIAEFDAEARRQNLTPAEGLSRLEDNADPLARQRGEDMAEAIDRAKRLSEQLQAIDVRKSPDAPLCRGQGLRSRDCEERARQLRTRRAAVARRARRRRPRRVLGLGGDAPHRVAVPPPFPASGDAGAIGRGRIPAEP